MNSEATLNQVEGPTRAEALGKTLE